MYTTQRSLIIRIRDASDVDAWGHFVEIYGPLIYRYGRRQGLQDADAADLSQLVLTEVAQCIHRFDYNTQLGRFRNWLLVIARYKLSRLKLKQARHARSGDSHVREQIDQQVAADEFADQWEAEYRTHLFQWAASRVRQEVKEVTWLAFWRTAVEGRPAAEVARELDINVGSVYVAKSRVLIRVRAKISEVDDSVAAKG